MRTAQQVWEEAYPDRRKWDELEQETKEEWKRIVRIAQTSQWQRINTIPKDGTNVLVWAVPMDEPDIAWHEASGTTMKTYTHWTPLPTPP